MRELFEKSGDVLENYDITILRRVEGRFRPDEHGLGRSRGDICTPQQAVRAYVKRTLNDVTVRAFVRCQATGLDLVADARWNGDADFTCEYHSTYADWLKSNPKSTSA